MTKEIVVAYYKENIEWLENVKDYKITIYNKSHIDIPNTIKLENVGREMNTYFHHIIENYDNLSDVIFFTKGNPLDHVSNYIEILNGYPQTLSNSVLSIGDAHFFSDIITFICDMYGNPYHWGLDMNIIWKSKVDEKYEVYVEQGEPYNGELVIKEGDKELTRKFVTISYDAKFGPDISDVTEWERVCIDFIDNTLNK